MFVELLRVYLQSLCLAVVCVVISGIVWIAWRASRKLDKTVKERQLFLYEAIMMAIMTAPILSFAFLAIIYMIKSH